jgi:5-methylcytosine-specific restriction endonuclease McrA
MNEPPLYLTKCDPLAKVFPKDWKVAYFRLYQGLTTGYGCPICKSLFQGQDGFEQLEGDHKKPRSKGGETIWANLQLLCEKCNKSKSDREILETSLL